MKAALKGMALVGAAVALICFAATPLAFADTNMGYVSFDMTSPNTAAFDVVNQTGPNSSGDATFPVTTSVSFSDLNLTVNFSGGGSESFGPSYFTLSADGLSWDGTSESTTVGPPSGFDGAISATLTGVFDTTSLTLFDGSTITIGPNFSATITDPTGGPLVNGDLALITASAGTATVTPEPESLLLFGTGLGAIAAIRRRLLAKRLLRKSAAICPLVLLACATLLPSQSASAAVKMNTWSSPSSGQAGLTFVNVTGSGFPSGSISPGSVTVYLATSCTTTGATTATVNQVATVVGNTERVQFEIPNSLTSGTYFVSLSGTTTGGTSFASGNCSEVNVTATSTTLAACVPTSSLAVSVGTNVNAYVPFGYWDASATGIEEVPLEGSSTAHNFATTGVVNSCAANSATGEIVCTENGNNVDLINGTTLTTLVSGANTLADFSGGNCENCGVGVNAANNTAVIAEGLTGGRGYSGSGVQFLNLASNTFGTPFPMANYVSEDISIDPGRNLILSPGEDGVYDLLKIGTGNTLTEFGNLVDVGEFDSAAEDCTTGIALASLEFTDDIYITDLTQSTFTPGSPAGTWTAPQQVINLSDGGYSAGTCGISSAPGTGHLAVVTGEFGGSSYSALQLPSTSGTGTPALVDYAYVGPMPSTPDGNPFSAGFDPHTVTAYTSPNTGKSYAVFVDYSGGVPSWLGVVDLSCVLSQPRIGPHTVDGNALACTRYVAIP